MDDFGNRRRNSGGIVFGLMLILLGAVLILRNVGLVPPTSRGLGWLTLWALLFISLGLVKLFTAGPHNRREGVGQLFVGSWLLLNQFQVLNYRDSWPILLIGIGIGIIWSAIERPRYRE
jgi:LiaF transmembrane domain